MPSGLTLANLNVKISADLSELSAKFSDVGKNFKKLGRSMSSVGSQMTRSITAPLLGLAYVMARGVTQAIQYGNEIDKFSKQTGLAAEEIQKLRYAAQQEHLDFEALAKLFPFLSKSIVDGTKDQVAAFKTMGISVTDATGKQKSSYNVMLEVANFMAGPGVTAEEKMTLAKTLMGKAAADAIPFLKLGREEIERLGKEFEKTGGMMSGETIVAMKKFDDKLTEVKERAAGLWRGLATDLIPILSKLVDALVPLIEKLKGLLKWFMALPPWVHKTTFAFTALVVSLGPILWYFGSLLTILPKILLMLKTLAVTGKAAALALGPFAIALAAIAAAGGYTIMGLKKYGDAQQAAMDATQKSNDALTDWLLKVREATPEALRMTDMWIDLYDKAYKALIKYTQKGNKEALEMFYDTITKLQKMTVDTKIAGPEVTGVGKKATAEEAAAFEKEWVKALFGKYAYERYLLYEFYNEKKEQGQDEVRLNQWLATESARIDDEYNNEKLDKEKKANEESAKLQTESYIKGVLERRDITTAEQVRLLEEKRVFLEQLGLQETDAYTKLAETIKGLQASAPVTFQEHWSQALQIVQEKFGFWGEYVSGLFSNIQSSFATNLAAMLKGTQSAAESLKKIWEGFKNFVIDAIADMIAKYLVFLAIQMATGGSLSFLGFLGLKDGGIIKPAHGADGLITRGAGLQDRIPALLRPNELVMPLDRFSEFAGAGAGNTNVTVNFTMGDVKTEMDYELMKRELADTIKNAVRGV